MDHADAMRLIASRSPDASREAAKTIQRFAVNSPVAVAVAERLIGHALSDPAAQFSPAERDALAALLTGDGGGRTAVINIRVSPAEKAAVQDAAEAAGETVSDHIRRRIGLD